MPKLLTHPPKGVQQILMLCTFLYTPNLFARDFDADLLAPLGPTALSRLAATPARVAFVGAPPAGLTLAEVEKAIAASSESWNSVACSSARLEFVGQQSLEDLAPDDVVVRFASPEEEDCLPNGFLGFTVICRGQRSVLLSTANTRWSNSASPYDVSDPLIVDTTAAITHEFGHVLGLGHDDTDARNTMTTRYLRDGGQASLSAADKLALCELYPFDRSECAVDSDCPSGHPCVSSNGVAVCDDERGDPGDYCGAELLICPFSCEITSPMTQTGYCSNPCERPDDCINDMVCVEQQCSIPVTKMQTSGCQTGNGSSIWWSFMVLLLWSRRSPRKRSSSAPNAFRSQSQ